MVTMVFMIIFVFTAINISKPTLKSMSAYLFCHPFLQRPKHYNKKTPLGTKRNKYTYLPPGVFTAFFIALHIFSDKILGNSE